MRIVHNNRVILSDNKIFLVLERVATRAHVICKIINPIIITGGIQVCSHAILCIYSCYKSKIAHIGLSIYNKIIKSQHHIHRPAQQLIFNNRTKFQMLAEICGILICLRYEQRVFPAKANVNGFDGKLIEGAKNRHSTRTHQNILQHQTYQQRQDRY